MSTIRTRLTAAYAAALVLTLLAFTAAVWAARRSGAYRDLERYALTQASLATAIMQQSARAGQPVTVVRDSLVGPAISPGLRTLLEGLPDYVFVLDSAGRSLYLSFAVRQLQLDEFAAVQAAAIAAPVSGVGQVIRVRDRLTLLLASLPVTGTRSAVSRVVVGVSTAPAERALRELLVTTVLVAPLLLIASLVLAYVIAGRAFRELGLVINEVQAISDGRSLHRRLAIPSSGDELARLTTTLNEMLERLENSFAGLRRFTADASHELKTPLAVLRADIERAMSQSTPRTDRLVALEEALQETTRMADLVNGLLTLARADERRFDITNEPVALGALVREVSETATILGESAGLRVEMPLVEEATVVGDAPRLRQLLLNLVTNAIKYTPGGGSVEITLARHDRTVVFSVRDTGIGISAEDLPHVFERFYRADRVRSRTSGRAGFGLGLAISQWVAEAHGGSISVRSRLARGSTFTVTLPLAVEGEAGAHPGSQHVGDAAAEPRAPVAGAVAGSPPQGRSGSEAG